MYNYILYDHVSEVVLNGSLCALQMRWSTRRIIDDTPTPSREFNYFKLYLYCLRPILTMHDVEISAVMAHALKSLTKKYFA